ncbi:MAG: formimidoylglutamase [Aestuariibacter sp.]
MTIEHFRFLSEQETRQLTRKRDGEVKLGQTFHIAQSFADLAGFKQQGCQFAIIAISEDIGPRANLGKGGASEGWQAFLSQFANLQDNQYLSGQRIALLGQVTMSATATDVQQLREQVAKLDAIVCQLVQQALGADLLPIVIGGGHNNAYPIIQACHQFHGLPLAVANLDPHCDFRAREGRHSGNGFRYAFDEGALSHYTIVGLHEQKNNQESLDALAEHSLPFHTIQDTHWRRNKNFDQVLEETGKYLMHSGLPVGIEIDLDAINQMPSSAITAAGLSGDDALYYLAQMANLPKVTYLHLAEGAPKRTDSYEQRTVGQMLAEMLCLFIKQRLAEKD